MPQVLVVGLSDEFCLDVQKRAQESGALSSGLRIKSSTSVDLAGDWLRLGGFSGVIFDPKVGFEAQQQLASLLWDKDALATFILYAPGSEGARDAEARLFGAQPITGQEAERRLDKILLILSQITEKPGSDNLLKIAVVEDLDSARDIICTYLEGVDNVETIGFNGVDSALAGLTKDPKRFDLVLTDIRMPKKTGADLIEAIRKDESLKKMPVIVLTAYGTSDVVIECLKAGATGFMVKPPRKKDLQLELARVRRILRYKLDPRLVFPNEIEKMRDILAAKGFV